MATILNNGWYNRMVNGSERSNRPPVHPFTLTFTPAELNREFDEYATYRSLSFARMSLTLAIVLYIAFSWLDILIIPEVVGILMAIRIVSCLMFIGVIYLTFTRWGIRNFQLLMSSTVVLASMGIIGMTIISESIGGHHFYAGLILAIMYAHTLLRIRFIYASLTTWLVVATYMTLTIMLDVTPLEIYTNNGYFLVSANIMGMFASFWLEYYMKAGFWNERILNDKSEELQKESLRKSTELEAGRAMQMNMLPQQFPFCVDYQFSFKMTTASEVGGDYYDYQIVNQIGNDGILTFGIGDATGHGLQASVMVTAIKLLFCEHAAKSDIVDFLNNASHSISLMDFRKIYMAFAIGRLTYNTLELAGAGMPPALIYRYKTKKVEQIYLKGMPLGTRNSFPYKRTVTKLEPGDAVMLMTDGLPELFNGRREMFGYDRVKQVFEEAGHLNPERIIDHVISQSIMWLNGTPQNDDMTFFVFRRTAEVLTNQVSDETPVQKAQTQI